MNLNSFTAEVGEKNISFLNSLQDKESKYHYAPVNLGITTAGSKLSLGFSCYALKTYYILGYWENTTDSNKKDWLSYIKSFQIISEKASENLFVDPEYINFIKKFNIGSYIKEGLKKSINTTGLKSYQTADVKFQNSIRAETKQSISTLYQVGDMQDYPYFEFENKDEKLLPFLDSLDWQNPWSAGAQFSAMCVFSKINDFEHNIKTLKNFSDRLVQSENGGYYFGSQPNSSLLINGAMKIITGLDWIDVPIHYPKKLIDLCLSIEPNDEGCDLVDIVYVLYKSSEETDYRKAEIKKYMLNLAQTIQKHYKKNEGGFSYFLNKSQHEYYGVNISKGFNVPDLHGNLLLIWALSMINKLINEEDSQWQILKP